MTRENEIDMERQVFAAVLAEQIMLNRSVFYFDESSICNWTGAPSRSWAAKGEHNVEVRNKIRHSATIMGTVGPGLKQPDAFALFDGGTTITK